MANPHAPSDLVLDNGLVRAVIARRGAELQSLVRRDLDLEYLWHGEPTWWPWRAPLLFPIVGKLAGDGYRFGGQCYELLQHGFAREHELTLTEAGPTAVRLVLEESPESLARFPFRFRLAVGWRLDEDHLVQSLAVTNPATEPLLFSLGLHPAFRWPIVPGEPQEAYAFELAVPEGAERWLLADGLLSGEVEPVPFDAGRLPLDAALFARGALVFKQLRSESVRVVSALSAHGIEVRFPGFPFFGLWTKPGAPFVCLEPWCGVADTVGGSGELPEKEGIIRLPPGATWQRQAEFRPF